MFFLSKETLEATSKITSVKTSQNSKSSKNTILGIIAEYYCSVILMVYKFSRSDDIVNLLIILPAD